VLSNKSILSTILYLFITHINKLNNTILSFSFNRTGLYGIRCQDTNGNLLTDTITSEELAEYLSSSSSNPVLPVSNPITSVSTNSGIGGISSSNSVLPVSDPFASGISIHSIMSGISSSNPVLPISNTIPCGISVHSGMGGISSSNPYTPQVMANTVGSITPYNRNVHGLDVHELAFPAGTNYQQSQSQFFPPGQPYYQNTQDSYQLGVYGSVVNSCFPVQSQQLNPGYQTPQDNKFASMAFGIVNI
jgi:hypothetical protein